MRSVLITLIYLSLNLISIFPSFAAVLSDSLRIDTLGFEKDHSLKFASNFLTNYLKYPSETGYERDAGHFFSNVCVQNGLKVRIFHDDSASYNFAASLYDLKSGKPNIILLNHIDVVPAGNLDEWVVDPYSGEIRDGFIYGRGALDCKGLAAMQLAALLDLKNDYPHNNFPYNVTLLCLSNEEEGGKLGAKKVIDEYFNELNPVVVLGEGGSGLKEVISSRPDTDVYGVSVAEKSSLWLKLDLNFISFGHGATPSVNYANKMMIDALNKINNRKIKLKFNKSNKLMFKTLGKEEKGLRGFVLRHINWTIFSPFVKKIVKNDPLLISFLSNTITVTNIYNPPGPPNKIASTSTAILDCRLLPGTTKKAFIRQLKKQLQEPNIIITVIDESPDAHFSKPDKYYKVFEKAITDYNPDAVVVPSLFPATTDNGYFREKDVSVFGLLPVIMDEEALGSIHGYNERISFDQLDSGIKIYTNFLENVMAVQTKPRRIKDYLKRIKRNSRNTHLYDLKE